VLSKVLSMTLLAGKAHSWNSHNIENKMIASMEANEFKETFEPVILSYKIALDKLYKTKDSNYSCGIPIRIFCG
jgi:hypothetical protein